MTISLNDDVLDLGNFEMQDKISKSSNWKFYAIMKLENRRKYIAKASTKTLKDFSKVMILNLSREIDIISRLNYPSLLKYVGYSLINFKKQKKPVIVMEYTPNFSLDCLFSLNERKNYFLYKKRIDDFSYKIENNNFSDDDEEQTCDIFSDWNDTKKLINIYGIASAMSYLHSHNILHRGLSAESIFLDEHLYPKISMFNNSIEIPENLNGNDQIEGSDIKGTLRYLAPEIVSRLLYSKSSDVYAFSILMYEIITNIRCFEKVKYTTDYISIVSEQKLRPDFEDDNDYKCIYKSYFDLIERCWSHDPKKRPTFDEIVNELKTNQGFITSKVDKDEFQRYIKFIDDEPISFDSRKRNTKFNVILKSKSNKLHKSDLMNEPYYISNWSNDLDLIKYKVTYNECLTDEYDEYSLLLNKDKNENENEITDFDERLKLAGFFDSDSESESYQGYDEIESSFDQDEEETETNSNQEKVEIDQKQKEEETEIDQKQNEEEIKTDQKQEEEIKIDQKQKEEETETDQKQEEEKVETDQKQEEKIENSQKPIQKEIKRYTAQVYNKEISSFYRYEIINLYQKLSIISQINHPSIVNFIGYSSVDFNNNPRPTIVQNYYYESIRDKLRFGSIFDNNRSFIDTQKLIWIYGIASGMAFLHSHNIIHRDLKLSNIFIDDNEFPRISGFDLSIEIGGDSIYKSDKIKGTPAYLAPEVYLNKEYSKYSDIYSFSLVMYEILNNCKVFSELKDPLQIKEFICDQNKRPTFFSPISESYRTLIERCWSSEPTSRPTFSEILTELRTNSKFITDEIDKEYFQEYIEFLDEFHSTFDSTKRFDQFDKLISNKLNTFHDIESTPHLSDMYETETNDISFNYNYIYVDDSKTNRIDDGHFYRVEKVLDKQTRKVMYVAKYPSEGFEDTLASYVLNFSRELVIISQLDHPSILKFIGYNPIYSTNKLPVVIVEYCSKNLNKYITNQSEKNEENDNDDNEEKLNDTNKLIIIYGIASGMEYLHSHNILHRDLKASNIFLDDLLYPKISGFNLSIEIGEDSIYKSDKIKGTPAYLAPEVYLNKEYSKYSDIYSFSLIMYEILNNCKVFSELKDPLQIKEFICDQNKRPTFFSPISESYRTLIERCWSSEPTSRPTFSEILTELRTNSKFITDEIDKEKYHEFIKYIDESPITFEPSKKITHFNYKYKSKLSNYLESKSKINFRNIYDTESDNILFNYNYINIDDYKKEKLIRINEDNEIKHYKITNKQTGLFYKARTIKRKFEDLYIRLKLHLYKEINYLLELNHPSILKFIGYSPIDFKKRPFPVIIEEYGINGTLESVLDLDMKNTTEPILNETKRLIIIYGIASGLLYLHSHNLIHCNLSTSNIYLDEFLFPKITGFDELDDLSKNSIPDILHESFGSIFYDENVFVPPERFLFGVDSSAGDVYSFSMILFELITNEKPFEQVDYDIIKKVCEKNLRPKIKESVPECYRKLIEKCWIRDPKERPTFIEIVNLLKTNSEFITEKINKEEYQNYVKFIDESQSKKDFLISNNQAFQKVQIDFNKIRNPTRLNFSVNMGSINLENYSKNEKIGSGSFGVVYKAYEKESQILYAAKISIYEMDQCTDDAIINLSREIDIISRLKHPSILQFIGFNPKNFKNKPKPVIITEFASNGSLDTIISNERLGIGNYNWDDTKKLINIYGIASGMAYLHNLNILHRDLKPGNILLDDFLYPKIADFGLSKTLYEEDIIGNKTKKNTLTSGFKGTYAYCSPEIIRNQKYTKAGDVYAFGIIVYEIMTNEFPFKGFNQYQLLLKINNGYRPPFKYPIPYCYKKLIERCWSEDDYNRPEFDKIVSLLETDPNFITPNVDEEEYRNYIFYVKENQQKYILLNEKNQIQTETLNNKVKNVSKSNENRKIIENIDDSNDNNNLFLDLSKFERKEIVYKGDFSKLYKFIEKDTGNVYIGQMSMLKIDKISNEEIEKLTNELNIISNLNHPSLLKFIGYSPIDFKKQRKPVIVTEFPHNKSLENMIEIERMNEKIHGWNDTKKLINIYGIASGMLYLHSNGIIHKSLKPSNIYLDEFLTPKIGDFGLSTRFYGSDSITVQSISGLKGTPIYSAPEVLINNDYTTSSDVYSFAYIVFELMTNDVPFNEISNSNQIFDEVVIKHNRPKFKKELHESYKKLIEICWSQDPNERPDFNEIVNILKTDKGFKTDNIDYEDYQQYINFIDKQINSCQIKENEIKNINVKEKNSLKEDEDKPKRIKEVDVEYNLLNDDDKSLKDEDKSNKIKEVDVEYNLLNDDDKSLKEEDKLLKEDDNKSLKEEDDKLLKEEEEDKSIKDDDKSLKKDCFNLSDNNIRYENDIETLDIKNLENQVKHYIKENDTENIYRYFCMLIKNGKCEIPIEFATQLYKNQYYKQALNYFTLISKVNHPIALYFIGVMKFMGQGCITNKDEAYKILNHLSDNGIEMASEFLDSRKLD